MRLLVIVLLLGCGPTFEHKPKVGQIGSTEIYRGAKATWTGWQECTVYVENGSKIGEVCK